MITREDLFWGKTFNDFVLTPQHGVIRSRKADTSLEMKLTRNISIQLPITSANMDTVTDEHMAKTLALEGGLAFLPRNNPIEEQVRMVRFVKRQHSLIIKEPAKIHKNASFDQVQDLLSWYRLEHGITISGLLVETDAESNTLAGVLSNRDINIWRNSGTKGIVKDFMTPRRKLVVGTANTKTDKAERLMLEKRVERLPLVKGDRMDGLITLRDLRLSRQKPYSSKDSGGRLMVGAAIGATGDFMDRAEALIAVGADCIVIDIAHADSKVGHEAVVAFRKKFKDIDLIFGNVATANAAQAVLNLGVRIDAIKIGIGPGAGCRTRIETGFGVPQLHAIRDVYLAVKNKVPLIADGGIKNDGDMTKAIFTGASTVMLGQMLSGTDETPGIVFTDPSTNQKMKIYRGMTSPEAVIDSHGNKNDMLDALETPSEGQSLPIPYKGSVVGLLERARGHLKSSVSYAGEKTLEKAQNKTAKNPEKFFIPQSVSAQKETLER